MSGSPEQITDSHTHTHRDLDCTQIFWTLCRIIKFPSYDIIKRKNYFHSKISCYVETKIYSLKNEK